MPIPKEEAIQRLRDLLPNLALSMSLEATHYPGTLVIAVGTKDPMGSYHVGAAFEAVPFLEDMRVALDAAEDDPDQVASAILAAFGSRDQ